MTDTNPLRHALRQVAYGQGLSADAAAAAFTVVMNGGATPAQIGGLLLGLRAKRETADEIAGAVQALRQAMVRVEADDPSAVVDTCGTGGGLITTFNVSTASAFIVAGAGVPVAKHGNRSYTSRSGSADVLEALGLDIALAAPAAAEVLRRIGLVFLFAPAYHPAMKHLAPTRRELGVPTIMNLVGPLANPAGAGRQVMGVFEATRAPLVAQALAQLGSRHALVVHADVGMDEISPWGATQLWEVQDGDVRTWTLDPERYGLAVAEQELEGLAGGGPEENAARIERLLDGGDTQVARCTTLLNAAAAIYVSGNGWTFDEAVARATASLDSGAAAAMLRRLREYGATGAPVSISG